MRLVKSPLRASSTSEARGLIASLVLVALLYGRGLGYGFGARVRRPYRRWA